MCKKNFFVKRGKKSIILAFVTNFQRNFCCFCADFVFILAKFSRANMNVL